MSKMKQHLEKQINITGKCHEETGWKRRLDFQYEGNDYQLTLFWDEFNGYEIFWRVPDKTPDWVVEWDSEAHEGMSFEHYLDELTYEMEWK
jgi:hypothetical protein